VVHQFNKLIDDERARKNVYYRKVNIKDLQIKWKDIEMNKYRVENGMKSTISTATINLDETEDYKEKNKFEVLDKKANKVDDSYSGHNHIQDEEIGMFRNEFFSQDY